MISVIKKNLKKKVTQKNFERAQSQKVSMHGQLHACAPNSAEARQAQRKLRNRVHAKNARLRRQQYVRELEELLAHLRQEIAELQSTVTALQTTKQDLMAENVSLQRAAQFFELCSD